MSARPKVRDAIDRFVARVRHNIDVHLEALAADLVKALEADGLSAADAQRMAGDIARAAGKGEPSAPQSRGDGLAKLLGAMRLLDESISLRAILDALARGAGSEASAVAVLLLDGDTLRAFSQFGFSGQRRPADLPSDSFAVLGRVVVERQRLVVPGGEANQKLDLPAFMRPAAGQTAVLIPLQVAGKVVAVVFAEGADRLTSEAGAIWAEHVEVLVRHASSRLENITSRRTVEVLTTAG
jgi:hypothetical protein